MKVFNTNITPLKQKMITNTMNQRNKIEIQDVVYKVKCLDSNSIYWRNRKKVKNKTRPTQTKC